jgi:hypothetical protein
MDASWRRNSGASDMRYSTFWYAAAIRAAEKAGDTERVAELRMDLLGAVVAVYSEGGRADDAISMAQRQLAKKALEAVDGNEPYPLTFDQMRREGIRDHLDWWRA